ncbi:MAG: prepilin-type N-terminal cleavage/methylation domain-containing protein [Proteobacteria bacterium]|nr:prepilin-type N-terminal cleavage/methylation domain-containing protein [Pseudomonadota bacterium]
MNTPITCKGTRGFSLVEVMVALVVICVGLLGIAKMQALSMSSSSVSRQRSLAAIEAAGIASAMRANRNYWATGPAAAPGFFVTYSAATALFTSSDAALAAAANAPGAATSCNGVAGVAAKCPLAVNLAAADLAAWVASVNGVLPNSTSTINCGVPLGTLLPPSCTVFMTWNETSVAMTSNEATQEAAAQGAASFEKPQYQLYVEP